MTTTVGVDDRDNDRIEQLIAERDDINSKKEAVTYALDAAERVADLEADVASLQQDLDSLPSPRDTHHQIFQSHGHDHVLSIPTDLAAYLLESGDAHRMFTLFEKYCPYLYVEHGVAGTMVESVYRLEGPTLTFLFVYHPLHTPTQPRAAFVVEGEWIEDEIVNVLESTEWAAPPGGVPHTYEFAGMPGEPTFGGVSRSVTDEERDLLYGLPTVEQVIDDAARANREAEAQERKQADEEGRRQVSQLVNVGDPDDLIQTVEDAYDEAFGLETTA